MNHIIESNIFFTKNHNLFKRDNFDYTDTQFDLSVRGVLINDDIKDNVADYIINLYNNKGVLFVKELRGSFIIRLNDKLRKITYLYTDHMGDHPLYYSKVENSFLASNDIHKITEIYKKTIGNLKISEDSAIEILTFGYLLKNKTLFEDIYKLTPGSFITLKEKSISVERYYRMNNEPKINKINDDVIRELDHKFTDAVELAFERDRLEEKPHIVSLSGGLDSRMSMWVPFKLNYSPLTCSTFSQTEYLDMTIPMEIIQDTNSHWIFQSLDGGGFLRNIDDVTKITGGRATYMGQTHGTHAYSSINFENFGIYHSGQLGDVIIGSYVNNDFYGSPYFDQAYSTILKSSIDTSIFDDYPNHETFLMESRGFNGVLTGNLPIQKFTESLSPFMNVDFFDFCMSIHLEERSHHKLYHQWINKIYPKAANYIWEKNEMKVNEINQFKIKLGDKNIPIKHIPRKVVKKLTRVIKHKDKNLQITKRHMNPFGYWYHENPMVKKFVESYYKENIARVTNQKLKNILEMLFTKGSIIEKLQVLTILSVYKNFILS